MTKDKSQFKSKNGCIYQGETQFKKLQKCFWVDFYVLARSTVNFHPIGVLKVSTDSLDPGDFKSGLKFDLGASQRP